MFFGTNAARQGTGLAPRFILLVPCEQFAAK